MSSSSRGIPEPLMKKVDDYVDSLAPQIQPRVTSELETFQQKTIDSLEDQVIGAFRSLFNKDGGKNSGSTSRGGGPFNLNDSAPDAYGDQSLPFADELAKLTRSFSKITDEAGDDLRDIFDLTEGGSGGGNRDGPTDTRSRGGNDDLSRGASKAKGFLNAAVNAVQDHLDDRKGSPGGGSGGGSGQKFELDGLLGVISGTVKDAARNPEEKARLISPEIRDKVGAKLREQHKPIAEQFTRIALDHIKRWLRGNTSARDLGDGAKGEIEDQVKGLVKGIGDMFGKDKSGSSRDRGGFGGNDDDDRDRGGDRGRDGDGDGEGSRGFSKVISDKLSTGLAKVHRQVRIEFRKILGKIEKQLFELLPDQFQRPLEKILGGNPFDSQLDRDAGDGNGNGNRDRGFRDDVKTKLLDKIRGLVRKVQETLRESILGVVNGGHRKFERESWVFVQNTVETKVQKYLPKVKISVPDDIGNEGVSVGDVPAGSAQVGGDRPGHASSQGGGGGGGGQGRPSSPGQQGGRPYDQQGYDSPPSQYRHSQDYRSDDRPQQQQQQHQQFNHSPDYQQSQGYNQGYQGGQDYRRDHQGGQGYQGSQGYQGGQGYQGSQGGQGYERDQGYQGGQSHQGSGSYQGRQNYQRDQGYQERQDYQGRQDYSGNQDYQNNQGYGQGYQQDQRYGQNPRY